MCKWLSIKQSVVLLMMPPHCSNDHAPKRLIILHACANVFSLPPVPRSLHSRGDVAAEETLFSHLQSLSASGGVREENAVVDLLVCSDVVYPAGRQEATMYRELAETIARICTRPGNSAPSWAMIGFEDRDSGVSWMSFLDTEGLLADPQTVAECQTLVAPLSRLSDRIRVMWSTPTFCVDTSLSSLQERFPQQADFFEDLFRLGAKRVRQMRAPGVLFSQPHENVALLLVSFVEEDT